MSGSTISNTTASLSARHSTNQLVGIWRLLQKVHTSRWTEIYFAQPADATGSPRADYVVKIVATGAPREQITGAAQIRAEVQALSRAKHPHLVPLLDFSLDGVSPFLVMPRLPGNTLGKWIQAERWQPLPVRLWWIRQIAQGLASLHTTGWCHGDVKPTNVMLSKSGHATLIDFGFSKAIGNSVSGSPFRGTLDYAAPELLGDAPNVSAASDIFSLGVVLWQLQNQATSARSFATNVTKYVESDDPVSQLIWQLTVSNPVDRPTAVVAVERLLRLEIESLGEHIRPTPMRQRLAA